MTMLDPSPLDWKLFRQRLPEWQEAYMARLCDTYAAILTGKARGSEAFWAVEKRIRADKKRPGVTADVSRSDMLWIMAGLLSDRAITTDDLDGFSADLKETLAFIMERAR